MQPSLTPARISARILDEFADRPDMVLTLARAFARAADRIRADKRAARARNAAPRPARERQPMRLASFIVKHGGLKDRGGDVRHILGGHTGRPGLYNSRGMENDDAALLATEAGYFPGFNLDQGDVPGEREFLDALADDLRGAAVYAQADFSRVEARDAFRAYDAARDQRAQMF